MKATYMILEYIAILIIALIFVWHDKIGSAFATIFIGTVIVGMIHHLKKHLDEED